MTLERVAVTAQGTLPASDIRHSSSGNNNTEKHRAGGNGARGAWKGAPGDRLGCKYRSSFSTQVNARSTLRMLQDTYVRT